MNAAQEYIRESAVRTATDALTRSCRCDTPHETQAIILYEALMAAAVALEAIGKLETMKREKAGD